MTIDERLEKLAERHESLAQSVEMLVIENRATGERIDKLGKFAGELTKSLNDLSKFSVKIATGTARLLSVAEAHEHRITRLEGQL